MRADRSDAAVPLLPVVFDMLERNVAVNRRKCGFLGEHDDLIYSKAFQRRWLMNTFFPKVADEYGAWKSCVPQLAGYLKKPFELISLVASDEAKQFGQDADANYLIENFKEKAKQLKIAPQSASIEQLEAMSELAHPVWGLPRLSNEEIKNLFAVTQEFTEIPNSHRDLALAIAIQAASLVDLRTSLQAIAQTTPNYEFERLYGLFAFLSKQNLHPEARREYALKMLPRLFAPELGDPTRLKLGEDTHFFSRFIPDSLTIGPEAYSKEEVKTLLDQCYAASSKTPDRRLIIEYSDLLLRPPTSRELSLALRAFAKDAPDTIAKVATDWTNGLLATFPGTSWYIDFLLFQLLSRKKALIDHQTYGVYFAKDNKRHMEHLFTHGFMPVPHVLDALDITVLQAWDLKDFDLFSELAELKTVGKPNFTPYDKAQKWAQALRTADPLNNVPSKELWHKILGGIAEEVRHTPPTNENDKIALRDLLKVLDNYSAALADDKFEELQKELGPIRLAADFSFDLSQRRAAALDEIRNLPHSSDLHSRIFFYFIPNFLLTQSESASVSTAESRSLLSDLWQISKTNTRYTEVDQWFKLFKVMEPFTLGGTPAQQELLMDWTGKILRQPNENSQMADAALLLTLNKFAQKIKHDDLVRYVGTQEHHYINLIKRYARGSLINLIEIYARGSLQPEGSAFIHDDFAMFAEIRQLNTANRQPLPYDIFARKLTVSVQALEPYSHVIVHLHDLIALLTKIEKRAAAVQPDRRDKSAISQLIQAIEHWDEKTSLRAQRLIDQLNQLRLLSDFSGPDANEDLQKAAIEFFGLPYSTLRAMSYERLIPFLLKKTAGSKDWIETTLPGIVAKQGLRLKTEHQQMLYKLFYPNKDRLSSIIDPLLKQTQNPSEVLNYLLTELGLDYSELSFPDLNAYYNKLGAGKEDFLLSLSRMNDLTNDPRETQKLNQAANGRLDLLLELMDIRMKGQPPLSILDYTQLLATSLSGHERECPACSRMLQKIIDLKPVSVQDKSAVSQLIERLDDNDALQDRAQWEKQLHTLRFMVDFTASPEENMAKAVGVLGDDSISYARRLIYVEIVYGPLFSQLKKDKESVNRLTTLLLDKLNKTKDNAVTFSMVINIFERLDRTQTQNAELKWLLNKIDRNEPLPPIAKKLFHNWMQKSAFIDYDDALKIWKKIPATELDWPKMLLQNNKLSTTPELCQASLADFRLLVELTQLPLNKIPEQSLAQTAESVANALHIIFPSDMQANVGTLLSLVEKKLHWTFFGMRKPSYSKQEKAALQKIADLFEKQDPWKKGFNQAKINLIKDAIKP